MFRLAEGRSHKRMLPPLRAFGSSRDPNLPWVSGVRCHAVQRGPCTHYLMADETRGGSAPSDDAAQKLIHCFKTSHPSAVGFNWWSGRQALTLACFLACPYRRQASRRDLIPDPWNRWTGCRGSRRNVAFRACRRSASAFSDELCGRAGRRRDALRRLVGERHGSACSADRWPIRIAPSSSSPPRARSPPSTCDNALLMGMRDMYLLLPESRASARNSLSSHKSWRFSPRLDEHHLPAHAIAFARRSYEFAAGASARSRH